MSERTPNTQYNLSAPDSLAIRVATWQRWRMYARFIEECRVSARDTILDVGVTSDRSYENSNYLEAWHPYKDRITASGVDDASFLEQLYRGVTFVRADGLDLPFEDGSFDVVHSSAVLEHVGDLGRQTRLIAECARVARKAVFMTTPNRWFPVEFHTGLPLVHWLPKSWFRFLMSRTGRTFFADERNLNLMTATELRHAAAEVFASRPIRPVILTQNLAGWPSNLLLVAR